MKAKLTLKAITMGISITIWSLRDPIAPNQGVKEPKIEYFLCFSLRNIYKSTCKHEYSIRDGRIKPELNLQTNTIGILITTWCLWVPVGGISGVK